MIKSGNENRNQCIKKAYHYRMLFKLRMNLSNTLKKRVLLPHSMQKVVYIKKDRSD